MAEPNKDQKTTKPEPVNPEPVKPVPAVPEMADPAVGAAVIAAMAQPGVTVELPNGLKLQTF